MTTQSHTDLETLRRIVRDNRPIDVRDTAQILMTETSLSSEEAQEMVNDVCEIQANGNMDVVTAFAGDIPSVEQAVFEETDQAPGEPTGLYYTGRAAGMDSEFVHEDDVDGIPRGLPVLEDVNHPFVKPVKHDYKPRELKGDRMDTEVVTKILNDPDFSTLLIGETGVGKDYLLKYILCNKCNWPVRRQNFGAGMTYEKLVGKFGPDDEANSGFSFIYAHLSDCVINGYAYIADELNAGPARNTMHLHGINESWEARELTIDETGQTIKPHELFRFIGTANPEDYAGVNKLNRAFKTRFYPIRIPYLEAEAEVEALLEQSNLSEHPQGSAAAEELVNLAGKLRSMAGDELRTPVSSREIVKIGNLAVDPDGTMFMNVEDATRLILEGIAMPVEWNSISSVIDRHFNG